MEEKKRKQISFDIPQEIHHQIKTQALKKNMSMTLWILRAMSEQYKKETQPNPKDEAGNC